MFHEILIFTLQVPEVWPVFLLLLLAWGGAVIWNRRTVQNDPRGAEVVKKSGTENKEQRWLCTEKASEIFFNAL